MSWKQIKNAIAIPDLGMLENQAASAVKLDKVSELRGMSAGRPTPESLGERLAYLQAAIAGTQYDSWAVITDDSFWEPEVNYQMLSDSGVDAFLIRAYGPDSWTDGAFNPHPDETYFRKFRAARATGKPVGAYVIHNPWEQVANPKDPKLAQIQIQQWKEALYGEYMPDWITVDAEINYCYRGGSRVTMPQTNYTDATRWILDAAVKEWGKVTWLYSRVTFLQEAGGPAMQTMLDNFNAGGTRAHLHLAYYPTSLYKTLPNNQADDFKPLLPAYTGSTKTFLEYGTTDVSTRIWQASPKLTHPACPQGTLDWNLVPLTPAQFAALVGAPEQPPAPPAPPVDETWKKAVETRLAELEGHTHQTLPPA